MATLFLKRGRANPLWQGHPWVYSGAVAREEGSYQPGDVIDVADAEGRFIGRGFINPRSQIRVRMVTTRDEAVDKHLITRRVQEAIGLRARLLMPSTETNAYRLINSEGDGLPGLVVDVYGDVCAVQFTALGMKLREVEVYDALSELLKPRAIVEVSAGGFAQVEGFASATRAVRGDDGAAAQVRCRENGIQLEVDPLHGQKTGMFLDQRENRRMLGALAKDARVLDVYTYAGGFALNALKGGAKSATCVDASGRALERVRAHAELNGMSNIETIEADAFRFLESARPRSFDIVVLDPPKFARARKDLDAAMKGYQRLNALGMNACSEGALLATCSCSQLVDGETFERVIAGAAKDAGRRVQLLEVASQGMDHPVPPAFPEGRYLKFVLCRVV
ncbi:MAG TPA: class I SAM-dependent rRNA methyltransferase [Polyangia bacterium]|nr:class I SAM-dependent rRNA methyltransferase [Polyangia bacterium]